MRYLNLPSTYDVSMRARNALNSRPWYVRASFAVAAVSGGIALGSWDGPGSPVCPLHAMTGLWCPGCGLTRAMVRLAHGDPYGAIRMNLLSPIVAGLLLWAVVSWIIGTRFLQPSALPGWFWRGTTLLLVVFGIVRNVPGLWFLRPI